MPYDPQMRASDEDRDRVASMLREHHAAGRLNADEFQERLDATFAAKTLGDLDQLMADLPGIDLYRLPEATIRPGQSRPDLAQHGRLSPAWRGAWGSWASVSLLLFTIWLITAIGSHHANGLWFMWVVGPWGAILLGRWLFGGHPGGGGPPRPVNGPPGGPVQQLQADREASPGDLPSERVSRHEEHLRRREEYLRRREQRMHDRRRDY